MFCADETLCEMTQPKMPSRGTELCAVVEAMFSYNSMFSIHGAFFDTCWGTGIASTTLGERGGTLTLRAPPPGRRRNHVC